jgi:hypothetical protein
MQSAIPLNVKISLEQLQGRGLTDANEFMSISQLHGMFSDQKSDGTVVASSTTSVALTLENKDILSAEAMQNSRFYRNRLGNMKTPTTESTELDHAMALQLQEQFQLSWTFRFGLVCSCILMFLN